MAVAAVRPADTTTTTTKAPIGATVISRPNMQVIGGAPVTAGGATPTTMMVMPSGIGGVGGMPLVLIPAGATLPNNVQYIAMPTSGASSAVGQHVLSALGGAGLGSAQILQASSGGAPLLIAGSHFNVGGVTEVPDATTTRT